MTKKTLMLISYFATWVPIITSPSFMRTLLKGLERGGGKLCQLSNVCFIQAEFCRFDRFTSYTGQHWETQLPTAPLQQPQKHDLTVCLFFCLRCVWLSLKNVQWLKMTLPPFLGSVSSSTFSSKLLSVGKPSKCLVRIHVLALIMMLCCRAEERNDRLKHSFVPAAMGDQSSDCSID